MKLRMRIPKSTTLQILSLVLDMTQNTQRRMAFSIVSHDSEVILSEVILSEDYTMFFSVK